MRISIFFATIFATLSVIAAPLPLHDSSDPSLSLRSDDTLSADAILYARARIPAHAAAKAARATVHKAAGLETQKTKSKAQTHVDRKARKEEKAVKKAEKAEKAKAKPNYKSHEQKIKDKATVTFSAGVSKRLDSMGLHGKERKSAKKYHKSIMLSEMKKNGATKGNVVATAHPGGTVKSEKNHMTAQFYHGDKKGMSNKGAIPSKWVDKATGKEKVGEKDQHHVYINDKKKVPSAWSNAVIKSHARKAAASEKEKAAAKEVHDAKVKVAHEEGKSIQHKTSPEEKKALRDARRAEKSEKKKKAGAL